jgi:hypothetical protein
MCALCRSDDHMIQERDAEDLTGAVFLFAQLSSTQGFSAASIAEPTL